MMISLAFLAPDLVAAAMDGRLPRGIGVTRLMDAPIEWSRQWHMLGLWHQAHSPGLCFPMDLLRRCQSADESKLAPA